MGNESFRPLRPVSIRQSCCGIPDEPRSPDDPSPPAPPAGRERSGGLASRVGHFLCRFGVCPAFGGFSPCFGSSCAGFAPAARLPCRTRSSSGVHAAENAMNSRPERVCENFIQAASPPNRGKTPRIDPTGVGIDTEPLTQQGASRVPKLGNWLHARVKAVC